MPGILRRFLARRWLRRNAPPPGPLCPLDGRPMGDGHTHYNGHWSTYKRPEQP